MTDKTKKFIEKAVSIHGDKYDYSLVNYINAESKVKIICKIHGEFEQPPHSHIQKHGCTKCGRDKTSDKLKTSKEDFIKKAIEIHGDKYDYSLVDYINGNIKVKLICKIHGEFEQIPRSHLIGQNCLKCGNINKTKTTEQFIEEAQLIHGDRYDYSKVEYTGSTGTNNRVIIICKIHGEFKQQPNSHLQRVGCKKCMTVNQTKTSEDFIKESQLIHGDKYYDYSKVEYTAAHKKVIIICKIHGEFKQTPSLHTNHKCGCPYCYNKTEGKIKEFLLENNIKFESQYQLENISKKFDFLIDNKYILEIDGVQHFPHSKLKQNKSIPLKKKIDTLNKDIKIMRNVLNIYPVIRLFQENIWKDNYDWKSLILSFEELEVNTLYIRFEEKEIYEYHMSNLNVEYLSE